MIIVDLSAAVLPILLLYVPISNDINAGISIGKSLVKLF